MTTDIDLKTVNTLKLDYLKKNNEQYAMVALSPQNIDAILALQDIIFASLSAEEQSYVLKKDKAFFDDHFANGNIVIGAVHNGKLVAQSIIVNPTPEHPKHGMVDMVLPGKVEEITIIQGVLVDPAYQGNRLMSAMVDTWLDIADKEHRGHAIAEVAVGNYYSWSVFLKEGMEIHSLGLDTSDGTELYNIHADIPALIQKRLTPDFNKAAAKNTVDCPLNDLAQQKKLVSEGYKGVGFDKAKNALQFKKPGA